NELGNLYDGSQGKALHRFRILVCRLMAHTDFQQRPHMRLRRDTGFVRHCAITGCSRIENSVALLYTGAPSLTPQWACNGSFGANFQRIERTAAQWIRRAAFSAEKVFTKYIAAFPNDPAVSEKFFVASIKGVCVGVKFVRDSNMEWLNLHADVF